MAPAVLPNILDMAIWRRSQPDSLLRRSDHVAQAGYWLLEKTTVVAICKNSMAL
jgi:hypothetical protein